MLVRCDVGHDHVIARKQRISVHHIRCSMKKLNALSVGSVVDDVAQVQVGVENCVEVHAFDRLLSTEIKHRLLNSSLVLPYNITLYGQTASQTPYPPYLETVTSTPLCTNTRTPPSSANKPQPPTIPSRNLPHSAHRPLGCPHMHIQIEPIHVLRLLLLLLHPLPLDTPKSHVRSGHLAKLTIDEPLLDFFSFIENGCEVPFRRADDGISHRFLG